MTKEYKIYTKKLAYELRVKGFKFIRTEVNENHPQFLVYVFENSNELQEALTQYTKR